MQCCRIMGLLLLLLLLLLHSRLYRDGCRQKRAWLAAGLTINFWMLRARCIWIMLLKRLRSRQHHLRAHLSLGTLRGEPQSHRPLRPPH
ncbi:hypothetical protein BAUCODRAFT_29290 [Baudoinia panamericana UAMH 10762]|uniref:Secreted protein n=1 Tax=Baudoinia panamericana (strain UAMH 10762) TaxID=717646 RepID=M2N9N3_BAUPA|nr:uncharacterized protein BAUCODRAFT_29290 [Baudoinia panamericana UAMH 10762]EMD00909.1 hypothetical protein BAUCODRAFT_29290 [Baudoinia panamericana UAMH 10762]